MSSVGNKARIKSQHVVDFLLSFAAAAITALTGGYAWRQRNVPGATALVGLLLPVIPYPQIS